MNATHMLTLTQLQPRQTGRVFAPAASVQLGLTAWDELR